LAKIRNNKRLSFFRSLVDQIDQPLFVSLKAEVIIFFLAKFDLAPLGSEFAIGAAFFIGEKLFLANRIITSLFIFVDLLLVFKAL